MRNCTFTFHNVHPRDCDISRTAPLITREANHPAIENHESFYRQRTTRRSRATSPEGSVRASFNLDILIHSPACAIRHLSFSPTPLHGRFSHDSAETHESDPPIVWVTDRQLRRTDKNSKKDRNSLPRGQQRSILKSCSTSRLLFCRKQEHTDVRSPPSCQKTLDHHHYRKYGRRTTSTTRTQVITRTNSKISLPLRSLRRSLTDHSGKKPNFRTTMNLPHLNRHEHTNAP